MTAITAPNHFFDDPIERRAYFAEEIRRMDEQSLIEGNRREAKEEGRAEGIINERERLVRNLLERLQDLGKATTLSGLDLKEVRDVITPKYSSALHSGQRILQYQFECGL